MQSSMDDLTSPAYPLAPGGRVPELNLAGVDGLNVASGQSIQYVPDPVVPIPMPLPRLEGSPEMGGIDPQAPVPELNLAGIAGVPSPEQLTRAGSVAIHEPDAGLPDFTQPTLQAYDLTGPGITQARDPLFAPDPLLPDLEEYRRPYGLTLHNQDSEQVFKPDPLLNELLSPDLPQGLEVRRDAQELDPLLPDLQQPELTQEVHMQQRPADMADEARQQLRMNSAYQALSDVPYRDVFMDQAGMNSSQRRHYDLLLSYYPEAGEA